MAELADGVVDLVTFDLDGTLADTVPDIVVALNRALDELRLEPVTETETRRWVGNGARVLCGRAISRSTRDTADPALAERLLGQFLDRYAERVCVETRLYDGARSCLDALRDGGTKLACITNKPEAHTASLLQALDLAGYFDAVVGGDSLPRKKPDAAPLQHVMTLLGVRPARTRKKPDAAPLQHVMTLLGVRPARALMVGDSATDIAAAHAANVRCLCVPYGYNQGKDILALGANGTLDTLAELPGLIEMGRPRLQERS